METSRGGAWSGTDDVRGLCGALARGLLETLGDKLYGAYVYGAVAFPDGGATGDVDFHVILGSAPDDRERAGLADLHAALERNFHTELDGYYVLLEHARRVSPPEHQLLPGVYDHSWALHRAHMRAGRCIVLHGPEPRQVYPEASWPELDVALEGELDYVAAHLHDYPAYCVLNLCRLMYSYATHDVVVSKRTCAAWAEDAHAEWRDLIQAARQAYDQRTTGREDEVLRSRVGAFYAFACARIGSVD